MTYSPEIEHSMRMFHDSLSEKDRRRYAAIEAAKLGHGSTEYISTLLGCDPKTIRQGQHDLDQLPDGLDGRVRKGVRSRQCQGFRRKSRVLLPETAFSPDDDRARGLKMRRF